MRIVRTAVMGLLLLVSLGGVARAQLLTNVATRASNDANAPRSHNFGSADTIYLFFDIEGVAAGEVTVNLLYGRQTVNSMRGKLGANRHFVVPLKPSGAWQAGQYTAEVSVNGRRLGGDSWMVSGGDYTQRPVSDSYTQRYNTRGNAQEIAGRWVYSKSGANGSTIVHVIAVAPTGQYEVYSGGRVIETGQLNAMQGRLSFQGTNVETGKVSNGNVTYFQRGNALIMRDPRGSGVTWYRETSAEGQGLLGHTEPPPQVRPQPSPTARPLAVVEKLQITGTYKYSSRDEGPQGPSTSFGAFEDIHCGIRGTLKKGSRIQALLRDADGREVMKMSLEPMARDVNIDRYSIPFRHPTQALKPGEYTIQVLLNDEDIGKPVRLTVNGSSVASNPPVTPSGGQDKDSMRDLVKVETSGAVQAAKKNPAQRYALLIGIGDYENKGVQRLNYPLEDVKALRGVLENPDAGGFSRDNIHVLTDRQATLAAIGEQLVWLRGMSTEADTVFIYFTGHGYNNGSRSYLGTANADPDNLNFTALSVAKFNEAVSLIKAKKKIIILDACHSGGMLIAARGDDKLTPQMLRDLHERAEGEVRLLSCSQNETSKEDPSLGHGVFTYFLLKGMGPTREADANRDGVVTVGELYEYLSRQVRKYGAEHGYIQTPCAEQKVTAGVIILSTKWKDR